jgi:hypothetical protein
VSCRRAHKKPDCRLILLYMLDTSSNLLSPSLTSGPRLDLFRDTIHLSALRTPQFPPNHLLKVHLLPSRLVPHSSNHTLSWTSHLNSGIIRFVFLVSLHTPRNDPSIDPTSPAINEKMAASTRIVKATAYTNGTLSWRLTRRALIECRAELARRSQIQELSREKRSESNDLHLGPDALPSWILYEQGKRVSSVERRKQERLNPLSIKGVP